MTASESPCSVCGRRREAGVRVVATDGPPLCEECLHKYDAALAEVLDEESRERARHSPLIEAEEIALNLIDTLESSRAAQEAADLTSPLARPKRRMLELVPPVEETPIIAPPPQPEPPEEPRLPTVVVLVDDAASARELHARLSRSEQFASVELSTKDPQVAATLREEMVAVDELASEDRLERAAHAIGEVPGGAVLVVAAQEMPGEDELRLLLNFAREADVEAGVVVSRSTGDSADPRALRVIVDRLGRAMWITREAAMPADVPRFEPRPSLLIQREVLRALSAAPASPHAQAEGIGLLRLIEYGYRLRCALLETAAP